MPRLTVLPGGAQSTPELSICRSPWARGGERTSPRRRPSERTHLTGPDAAHGGDGPVIHVSSAEEPRPPEGAPPVFRSAVAPCRPSIPPCLTTATARLSSWSMPHRSAASRPASLSCLRRSFVWAFRLDPALSGGAQECQSRSGSDGWSRFISKLTHPTYGHMTQLRRMPIAKGGPSMPALCLTY
jgi:hypothetical protein